MSKEISIFLCNVQFTKDAGAFCVTGVKLDNAKTITTFDPNEKTYNINGKDVQGHFMVDYTAAQIDHNVSMNQAIFSRPSFYDGLSPVLNVDGILSSKTPPRVWLNFQYQAFYDQHDVKLVDKVLEMLRLYTIDFISSPEIGFLTSVNEKVRKKTKFIFQFLNASDVEPTTMQPYGTIVKDLAAIKSYASGIIVPKEYIWPVKPNNYLGPLTTLVSDAHKQGLEVYASGFANDFFSSYDYNYDPTAEYLQFIVKDECVDGLVTDFPSTFLNFMCLIVALATAAKAKLLLRELKTVKADLAFAKARCAQLEEENKLLREREGSDKGLIRDDDDLGKVTVHTFASISSSNGNQSQATSARTASQSTVTVDIPSTKVEAAASAPDINVKEEVEVKNEPKKSAFVDVSPEETVQKNAFERFKDVDESSSFKEARALAEASQNGAPFNQDYYFNTFF
ncbi:unnamed protein product [Vicia faba]|uniref:glycerophosphodiester phosphodiesterase n=1 Tax=Vicia faba TaxID=3906 RepID=A0AAV0YMC8_VICFA|nr:unnamed protein product [Vicia faba]